MRRSFLTVILCLASGFPGAVAQDVFESLGLLGRNVTSLSVNYGILAVGTDRQGVYWQSAFDPSREGWAAIGLDTLTVRSVYAHKSGPLGWAISAGVKPDDAGDPFLYCSYLGGAFEPRSHGIVDSLTSAIVDLDGFPDPTICGETYAAGGKAVYRRYFIDTTWTPVYLTTHDGDIRTVKVRQEYPGFVLAGGGAGFSGFLLIRSADFGETWSDVSPPTTVVGVDFGGVGAETIFAAGPSDIYRSTDGGRAWDRVWNGVGFYSISDIAYDDAGGYVFAAGRLASPDTSGVLVVSTDDGATWRVIALATGPIVGLSMNAGRVFVATRYDGVYMFEQTSVRVDDESPPGDLALYQNYPNPFGTATTITYSLERATVVNLAVTDILGRQITVLDSGSRPAGIYRVRFDATALPAGVYFYRLDVGESVQTRSMVVLRQ